MPNRPQDRKPKKLNIGGTAVAQALGLQSANMAQKAMLDNLVAKVVATLRVLTQGDLATYAMNLDGTFSLQGEDEYHDVNEASKALNQILSIMKMDRLQIAELTSRPDSGYPDQEIQEVMDEAVNKMVALLMDPDRLKATGA